MTLHEIQNCQMKDFTEGYTFNESSGNNLLTFALKHKYC